MVAGAERGSRREDKMGQAVIYLGPNVPSQNYSLKESLAKSI